MNINRKSSFLWGVVIFVLFQLSSCDPVTALWFKNCTSDTLFIGASHYDDIDSVCNRLLPPLSAGEVGDTTLLTLWGWTDCYIHNYEAIFPDSFCYIYEHRLFNNTDTSYLFLVKWSDAHRCSWDEIRANKLYRKWVVTRDKNGEHDMNIRYLDSDEQE